MARNTISVIRRSGAVDLVALAGPDHWLAKEMNVEWVPDKGSLNASLEAARKWGVSRRARALMILPADLPFLTAEDVSAMGGSDDRELVRIAATDDGGTGALFVSPPDILDFSFGADSFRSHLESANRRGVTVERIDRRGLTFDLDTVQDFERYERLSAQNHPPGTNLLV